MNLTGFNFFFKSMIVYLHKIICNFNLKYFLSGFFNEQVEI